MTAATGRFYWFLMLFFICPDISGADASDPDKNRRYNIKYIPASLTLDGQATESCWNNVESTGGFTLNFPTDTVSSTQQTRIKLFFNEDYIAIYGYCGYPIDKTPSVQTLKRDFNLNTNDNFTIVIDPLHDQNNGFQFSLSPQGVQYEAVLYSGSRSDNVWDNKWQAATYETDSFWSFEAIIPFRSIRYNEQRRTWGINFIRQDISLNERSSWQPVPREFDVNSLLYAGDLIWEQSPPPSKGSVSIIPYIMSGTSNVGARRDWVYNAGADMKMAVSSSLNLDLTVNPDFSQVEVDRQVINLERFNVYFPERRNFFIENNDLFANFGFTKIRPFFSRRIGLNDTSVVPLYFGARLSGKINQDWRVGLLNVQSGNGSDIRGGQNYSVACFQRQLGSSNLAGIFVNRQAVGGNQGNDYNRVMGLDYNILSKDQRWMGKVFYHQSFTDGSDKFEYAHASWLTHRRESMQYTWNHEYVSKYYNAETGFVPRQGTGYWRLEPSVRKYFYPQGKVINNHGPRIYLDLYTDEALVKTDHSIQTSYFFSFANTSEFRIHYTNSFVRLKTPFNPNPSDSVKFPVGAYQWQDVSMNYDPADRKSLSASFFAQYGSFYMGRKLSYGGNLVYRFQPFFQFSVNMSLNDLIMPAPYSYSRLVLISPKFDVSFSQKLFFSSFIQLNSQAENLGINARLQYRFKPMSDVFIVYNQNFDDRLQESLNNTIVLKFSYWLNV